MRIEFGIKFEKIISEMIHIYIYIYIYIYILRTNE